MLSKMVNDPSDTNYTGNIESSFSSKYVISDYNYGKNNVKVLQLVKNGPIHSIKEFVVCSKLQLDSIKDYTNGE